ncbi:cytoplasmic protein NCK2 [Patella vulgata]|uniref:cytoplasmic protein NCK2 n=1 Tax=Patella vulgata TaxID=6465 RepID=UPI0024A95FEC|nr:cytoplasmic protein NCK2 [Patella vulgata]
MAEEVVVVAKYDYKAENTQELNIKKNERLILLDDSKDWWKVQNADNKSGFVPSNYVKRGKKGGLLTSLKSIGRSKKDQKGGIGTPPALRNGDSRRNQPHNESPLNNPTAQVVFEPAIVKYMYTAQRNDEMSLIKGERLVVTEKSSDGWWKGQKDDGTLGWFPSNYVDLNSNGNEEADNVLYWTAAAAESLSQESSEIVVTLYPFKSSNKEELGFEKGERLEIVEKPVEDPEWWRARNSRGEMGLVPRSYVQILEDVNNGERATSVTSSCTPQSESTSSLSNASSLGQGGRKQFHISGPMSDKDWYYGKITRQQCEDLLSKHAENGDFLIRDSESTSGHFTVVLKAPNRNKHFRVQINEDGKYEIGPQKFEDLECLIEHYKRHPIYKQENEKLYLIKPFTLPPDF